MIKNILFDLDGTLLPMDQDFFTKTYLKAISQKLIPYGYDANEVITGIWQGVKAMVKNDGIKTNEEAFWNSFVCSVGEQILNLRPVFDDFYENDFPKISSSCGYTEKAKMLIDALKERHYKLILATNPIFPSAATNHRISWAGLKREDFHLITYYENCRFCKPNLNYYSDILKTLGLRADECLMVGNDVNEDMIAEKLGINTFLLTDCLINKSCQDISHFNNGSFDELYEFISRLNNKR